MAVTNKRTFLSKSAAKDKTVDQRLRNKLKESYDEYLNEADEDEELADEDIDMDVDDESGLDLSGEDGEDIVDSEEDELGIDAELTPDQSEFVDDEIDMLLEPEVEELELSEADDFDFGDEDELDIESDVDDFDPAIDDEELQSIIDSPDTYDELGNTLTDMAIEEFPSDEDSFEDDDFDEDAFSDEIDAEAEVEAELEEAMMNENFDFETETPMTESRKKVKRNRSIREDVKLQAGLKGLDFDEESEPSEVKKGTYSKVSDTAKGGPAKGKITHGKGLTQNMKSQTMKKEAIEVMRKESVQKSKMLVKAAQKINGLEDKVKQLQLENYRLLKANGILSVTGDKLDKQSRAAISESFSKCKNKVQVDALYEKVVRIVKEKSRPSLNEAVSSVKKTTVKTAAILQEKEEKYSFAEQRKQMLMGLKTSDDVYFSKFDD